MDDHSSRPGECRRYTAQKANTVESHDTNQKQPNMLGGFSLALAIVSFLVSVSCITYVSRIESAKIPNREYESHDPSVLTDPAFNGLSFIGQVVVYGVGFLVGGTLAAASMIAGAIAMMEEKQRAAISGLIISLLSLITLFGFLTANDIL